MKKYVFGVLLAVVHLGAFAQSPDSFASTKWSYQLGSDAWALDASKKKDTEKSYVEDNSNLLLPNSYTQWPYQDVSGYGRLTGSLQLGSGVEASVKVRADQTIGFRVDEAFAQKNISPFFGIRAGVVDYKTSWCRTYESDTVWIREVEVICNTPQFRDVTGGAPGVQIVINNTAGNYLIQSQAGIYRPLLLDFAPKEFGNVVPGADYRVDRNDKLGLNVNLVNLETALEARVSYIQAIQRAYSPELQGTTKQASDLIYIGLSFPFSSRVNVRGTHVLQLLQNTCRSEDATLAMGSACNLNRNDRKTSTSLEIIYQVGVTDVVSLGVNEFNLSSQQTLFNSTLDVYAQADLFSIKSRQISMAWRRDWGNGYYSVVQVLESEQKTQSQSSSYPSNGWGLGLRLGYQF
jgi:hypothetical protein